MKKHTTIFITLILISLFYISCAKQDSFINTSDKTFSIPENFPADSVFGAITITDQSKEDEDVISYIIGGNPDTVFGIIPSTGELYIRDSSAIDYEVNTSFEFVVETKYANLLGYSASTITVNIEDIQPVSTNLMTYLKFDGNTLNSADTIHGQVFDESYNTSFGTKYLAQSFNGNSSYTDLNQSFDTLNLSVNLWFNCHPNSEFPAYIFCNDSPALLFGRKSLSIETSENDTLLIFEGNDFKDSTVIETNRWYMVTITISGSFFKYYLDGESIGQKAVTAFSASAVGYENALVGCSSNFEYYFNGLIDDLRVYAKILTPAEIEVLFVE